MVIGHRLITTTAWEDAEAPDNYFEVAAAATTMVCLPDRLNPMWVRCKGCRQMTDYGRGQGKCQCGQPLSEHPPYW